MIFNIIVILFLLMCITSSLHLLKSPLHDTNRKIPRSVQLSRLHGFSYDKNENSGLSVKVIGTLAFLTIGVFGTGFIGTINSSIRYIVVSQEPQTQRLKGTKNQENRGALTRLTRKEINEKLRSIPIFYPTVDNGKSIYLQDGKGTFFTELEDAKNFYKSIDPEVTISATSLDDVYFTLIEKKTKIGKYITGLSANSDITATYEFITTKSKYDSLSERYKQTHSINDIPLFRVPNLVFSKEEGLEVPLFLLKEDAITSYERLKTSKATQASSVSEINRDNSVAPLVLQEVSLLDVIKLFETGGFEARSLEFYPSIYSIENARKLMGLSEIDVTQK